jgi:hypothetical protein
VDYLIKKIPSLSTSNYWCADLEIFLYYEYSQYHDHCHSLIISLVGKWVLSILLAALQHTAHGVLTEPAKSAFLTQIIKIQASDKERPVS